MKIPRREFLRGSLLGLGGTVLGCRSMVDSPSADASFDAAERVRLGKTGIRLSRVGLGTGMNGFNRASNQTRLGPEKFSALIRGCYERGLNWFDTADLYGSHPCVVPALEGVRREDYVLVSKIWYHKGGIPTPVEERPDADTMVERFLREMGTDYIDMVLLHCMTAGDWNGRFERQMEKLADLKRRGMIRAHGVSCHSLEALAAAAAEPWVDSIHARINPFGESMDGAPEAVVPLLRQAHENGKGVVGMKLIGAGRFRDSDLQRNQSVDFVLNLGCVDTLVVGFESLAEADDLIERVRRTPRRRIAAV